MQVPPFWGWTKPQTGMPNAPGFTTVETSNPSTKLEYFAGDQHYVVAKVKTSPLKKGDAVTFIYGNTDGGKNPGALAKADYYAESREKFFIKVDGDGDDHYFPLPRESQPYFKVLPGPAKKIIANAPSIVQVGEPFQMNVAALDEMENNACSYNGKVVLSVKNPAGEEKSMELELPKDSMGAKLFTHSLDKPGVHIFSVEDREKGFWAEGNPILAIEKEPKYNLFWGDLHGHSSLSDGTGTPEDYYRYAKIVSRLDVSALTDHDAWGLLLMDQNPDIWNHIKTAAYEFYVPGGFVTFAGYEWTNWKHGHKHVLFRKATESLLSSRFPEYDTPDKLWKALPDGEAITISHHPGGGPVGADWSFSDPAKEPLVEIASIHGNSEKPNAPLGIYHPRQGGFVQDALGKGMHLGILASGDSHNGHPGRRDPRARLSGLAGIFAKSLDREGIWEALVHRRVYGTTGPRIILRFLVNGRFMGEDVFLRDEKVPRQIFMEAVGTDVIKRMDVIKNNMEIYSEGPQKREVKIAFDDNSPAKKGDYYYVRLEQQDGGMAWSSPVFIDISRN